MLRSLKSAFGVALLVGVTNLAFVGCASEEPPASPSGGAMSGEMAKDKMEGGDMAKDKMGGDMAKDKMEGGDMAKDKMSGDMAKDKMGGDMAKDKMEGPK